MSTKIVRLVNRDSDGSIRVREFDGLDELLRTYEQVGIDDCSTDLSLRGFPILRGLVGPIPDGKGIARYETADAFESLTKDWAKAKVRRRRRRASAKQETVSAETASSETTAAMPMVDMPHTVDSMTVM